MISMVDLSQRRGSGGSYQAGLAEAKERRGGSEAAGFEKNSDQIKEKK